MEEGRRVGRWQQLAWRWEKGGERDEAGRVLSERLIARLWETHTCTSAATLRPKLCDAQPQN